MDDEQDPAASADTSPLELNSRQYRIRRRDFIAGSASLAAVAAATFGSGGAAHAATSAAPGDPHAPLNAYRPSKSRSATRFAIGYEPWFIPSGVTWEHREATPVLGQYRSDDPEVIAQHARWITGAGIDYILIDWSNNLGGNWPASRATIDATLKLLEVYAGLRHHPNIALLIGLDNGEVDTANFRAQMRIIEDKILGNSTYAKMWETFHGRPLLTIYGVSPTDGPPTYENDKFTIRFMDAFHEIVMNPWGNWSDGDRSPIVNGPMEFLPRFSPTDFNGWVADGNWSLASGGYLGTYATTEPAAGARKGSLTSPAFVVTERAMTFYTSGLEQSPTATGDYSTIESIGDRNLFLLVDAETDEVLRHAEPPGWTPIPFLAPSLQVPDAPVFYLRQWDLSDLHGRRVKFRAINNNASGPTFGWIACGGVAQTACEQMTAVVATAGNNGPGSWLDWDHHPRSSGAYLVEMMQGAFSWEPEVVLIQQWNEFSNPDAHSVELSNDIEPTIVHELAGPDSDGWGTYYLDLVKKLIEQYRHGVPRPQVLLDSRYP